MLPWGGSGLWPVWARVQWGSVCFRPRLLDQTAGTPGGPAGGSRPRMVGVGEPGRGLQGAPNLQTGAPKLAVVRGLGNGCRGSGAGPAGGRCGKSDTIANVLPSKSPGSLQLKCILNFPPPHVSGRGLTETSHFSKLTSRNSFSRGNRSRSELRALLVAVKILEGSRDPPRPCGEQESRPTPAGLSGQRSCRVGLFQRHF